MFPSISIVALASFLCGADLGPLLELGGPSPAPLRAPHFPRAIDEFVFKNWGAVPLERMAAAIGARPEDLRALAIAMGLGEAPAISPEAWRRGYLTVIRRNWHLLPWEQLLALLDWDAAKLATILREDDFFWIKLGSLKPRCEPLRFEPIPKDLEARFAVIRRTTEEVLGPKGLREFRRRFAFIDELASPELRPRRPALAPSKGEISLERGWTLVLPAAPSGNGNGDGNGEIAAAAAGRFAAFLRDGLGAEAPRIVAAAEAPKSGLAIAFTLDPAAFEKSESHEIRVRHDRIELRARDGAGLLRALDRLRDRLELRNGPWLEPGDERRETRFALRFLYSYSALYGDPLLEPDLDPYPDGYLEKLSRLGVNGVWLQGLLRNLAPLPPVSTRTSGAEIDPRAADRLANLSKLARRARRFGIGLYLYLNEPRGMPASFFSGREGMRGVAEGPLFACCTSAPETREWLSASLAHVFREVPELAGVFTITMSENLTSCWSHGGGKGCPRCGARAGHEVVAEVDRAIFEGVRRSSPLARVIAWDWGWPDDWIEPILAALPSGVDHQSVSEWSLPIQRGGIASAVGEYSISAVGPGPRAARAWGIARRTGHRAFAKIQANCTWELAAVPYIPAVQLVAEHARRLAASGVEGLMLGWTLGGYPSPNLEAASQYYFSSSLERSPGGPSAEEAVLRVARRRFDRADVRVAHAWKEFGEAFQAFPYHISVVYQGPQQWGPANLLYPDDTGYRATMVGFPYDDLDGWRGIYPAAAFIEALRTVASGWEKGLSSLREDPDPDSPARSEIAAERRVAMAALLHFRSAANQAEFVQLRRAYGGVKEPAEALRILTSLRGLLLREIDAARGLLRLLREDSRIGFEASNHYFYLPGDLAEKVLNCRWLIEEWIGKEILRWKH